MEDYISIIYPHSTEWLTDWLAQLSTYCSFIPLEANPWIPPFLYFNPYVVYDLETLMKPPPPASTLPPKLPLVECHYDNIIILWFWIIFQSATLKDATTTGATLKECHNEISLIW